MALSLASYAKAGAGWVLLQKRWLANHACWLPYRVGRYRVDLTAFESLILPAIDPMRAGAPLIVIDEIGKMECFSAHFRKSVVAAMESDRAVLATIALRGDSFVESLKARSDVTLLHVTQHNRDELVGQVLGWAHEVSI